MLLKGKTAVITGVSRGIGRAVLELFAENGANIIACSRQRNSEQEETLQNIAQKNNIKITMQYFDLSDEQSIKEAGKNIVSGKNCDILVNCAGIAHSALLQMSPIADIRHVFEVNYFGQITLIQSIAKFMIYKKTGSIINITAYLGTNGWRGNIAYGASKAALILATEVLSKEFAPFGIRVNAVAPGPIDTDMLAQTDKKVREEVASTMALGRVGKPRELAQAVLFLASDMASYITGQVLHVDGGL
jgi:3-oxoacyl-[acyl-carrier protein] reductase